MCVFSSAISNHALRANRRALRDVMLVLNELVAKEPLEMRSYVAQSCDPVDQISREMESVRSSNRMDS